MRDEPVYQHMSAEGIDVEPPFLSKRNHIAGLALPVALSGVAIDMIQRKRSASQNG